MLRIGITPGYIYPDPGRDTYSGKTLNYLERDTANFLLRHDALPVLIPDCDTEILARIVSQLDGLILQGGEDIAAETYGESPIGPWRGDAHRDKVELRIMEEAMRANLPVLGICRGFQLMNVYFGGTLYQDIGTQLPDATAHRDMESYDLHQHSIKFIGQNILQTLYKEVERPIVNSIHHQAIKQLGKELELIAECPDDGIQEAFVLKNRQHSRVMGVQWHPEFAYKMPDMLDADVLLQHFLGIC